MNTKVLLIFSFLLSACLITKAGNPVVTLTLTPSNVVCNGGNSGAVDLTVNNGSGNYTYAWSNSSTQQDLSAVTAGTYCVTVVDLTYNVTISNCATVTEPAAIVATAVIDNVNCFGGSDGKINMSVSGGVGPYGYHWSNNDNVEDLLGVAAGQYIVTITDASLCVARDTFDLTEPAVLVVNISVQEISCNGLSDGRLTAVPTGGTSPYFYQWNNNSSASGLNNLGAGTYSVTVYDNEGCIQADTASLTQPLPLSTSGTVINLQCATNPNGAIDLTVTNGTGNISYTWSDGNASTQDRANLKKGTYSVTVLDGNGCTTTNTFTVNSPDTFVVTATVTDASVFGGNDGAIDLTATGGVAPYLYSWSNGAQTQDITGLTAQCYSATVSDNNGCTKLVTNCVAQPADTTTTGIFDVTNDNSIILFPNPASTTLNIDVKGKSGAVEVAVFNMMGQEVAFYYNASKGNSSITTIDIATLPKGSYIVSVNNGTVYKRQLIEKQ